MLYSCGSNNSWTLTGCNGSDSDKDFYDSSAASEKCSNQIGSTMPSNRERSSTLKFLFTSFPHQEGFKVLRSACLYVCLYLKTKCPTSWNFLYMLQMAMSVLLWWQYSILYTSGFVDDLMFSHNSTNGTESNTTLCFVQLARWRHRGEVCYPRLPCRLFR